MTKTVFLLPLAFIAGCGADGGPTQADVLAGYAALVEANYADALTTATSLKTQIDAFVASPSAATLTSAREAWLAARRPYGQTEAFRFYDGPIDGADGPEGQLNAWPMDEAYVDYVQTASAAGIINDVSIALTKERLKSLNEGGEGDIVQRGGGAFDEEAAVATGYHAIEFLLWGQDVSTTGPGNRPHTDFLEDATATAPNGDRRKLYLQLVTEILIEDLQTVAAAWSADDMSNYRNAVFLAPGSEDERLRDVIGAIGILAKGELASERMDVALDTNDQEDEHSCFSDNTLVDIEMNALGVQNVYLGRYGSVSGPSIRDLVAAQDADLAADIEAKLEASLGLIRTLPAPFDQAIAMADSSEWMQVDAAVNSLFDVGDSIAEIGPAIGLGNISVELP